jgi:antitoxin component of RelBE/YafQ-DinJ toxin-antitoxin module
MKDAGMRIRVEQQLRDEFIAACRSKDLPASRVIRRFMKSYVEKILGPAPGTIKRIARKQTHA